MFRKAAVIAVLFSTTSPAILASHLPLSQDEMIRNAPIIAVIRIENVTTDYNRAGMWSYHQKAHCRTERVVKGVLPKEFDVLARSGYRCDTTKYEPDSRYLVMLNEKDGHYITYWWGQGQNLVSPTDNKLRWFGDDKTLDDVVQEIENALTFRGEIRTISSVSSYDGDDVRRCSPDASRLLTLHIPDNFPIVILKKADKRRYAVTDVEATFGDKERSLYGREYLFREDGRIGHDDGTVRLIVKPVKKPPADGP